MSTAKTKIALIGTGTWGREHARIYASHPDVSFIAIAGRDAEKTAARAAEYRVRSYTSIEKMLDTEKPDLVALCLGNQDHFEPTLKIIQAGFPLFVEKPFTFDLKEADTLLAEAEKRKLF